MKQSDNKGDALIGQVLKQHAAQPLDNEWFTPRVVNRLPERHSNFGLIGRLFIVLALLVLAGAWVYFAKTFTLQVVTVSNIIELITLCVMSVAAVASILWQVFSKQ